jgi:peptide/nickel transport system permease protein
MREPAAVGGATPLIQAPPARARGGVVRRVRRVFRRYPMAAVAAIIITLFVLMAVLAPVIAPYAPDLADGRKSLQSPSADHIFGTDKFGRDVFSRIIYGARVSLIVGGMAVLVAGAIGVPLGLISGYFGGWADTIVMRFTDAFMAFPGLVLALALVLVLEPSVLTICIALGLTAWPRYARLVRSQVLSLKTLDFITAARAMGAPNSRILLRHIWPNATAPVIVAASLSLGVAVLAEAGLSFLGVGVRPPTPTWGGMLNQSFSLIYTSAYLSFFPGVAIFLLTLSFNLLGDGLRDALDPRLRRQS